MANPKTVTPKEILGSLYALQKTLTVDKKKATAEKTATNKVFTTARKAEEKLIKELAQVKVKIEKAKEASAKEVAVKAPAKKAPAKKVSAPKEPAKKAAAQKAPAKKVSTKK